MGSGGVSDFTSNLSRSKSFRYSMASGLGGREGMGREGEDMLTTGAPTGASTGASTGSVLVSFLPVYQDCQRAHVSATAKLGGGLLVSESFSLFSCTHGTKEKL